MAKTNKKITFNKDNSVTLETPGGKKFDLTRDEYKRYNEQITGGSKNLATPTTPQVKEAVGIEQSNVQARKVAAGQATTPNVNVSNTAQAAVQPQAQTPAQIPPLLVPGQPQVVQQPQGIAQQLQVPQEQQAPSLTEGLVNPSSNADVQNIVQSAQGTPLQQALVYPKIVKAVLKEAVELGSAIKSFGTGDTITVKNIKNEYADIKTGLDKQITAVSQGYGDPQELLANYNSLVSAVERLDVEKKRRGIDNLPYWLTSRNEGLQGDIDGMKSQLEGLRQDITVAEIQGNQKKQQRLLQELQQQAIEEASVLQ